MLARSKGFAPNETITEMIMAAGGAFRPRYGRRVARRVGGTRQLFRRQPIAERGFIGIAVAALLAVAAAAIGFIIAGFDAIALLAVAPRRSFSRRSSWLASNYGWQPFFSQHCKTDRTLMPEFMQ